MLSTIYVNMAEGVTADELRQHLADSYKEEEFVVVLPKGVAPHTRHVRGSNYCLVNVFPDRIPGRAIIVSVVRVGCAVWDDQGGGEDRGARLNYALVRIQSMHCDDHNLHTCW